MDGRTLTAGAVIGVRRIKNPILLAREVMEKSPHVVLAGAGAEQFAASLGHLLMPNDYFQTDRARDELAQVKAFEAAGQSPDSIEKHINLDPPGADPRKKSGTVGCVAVDRHGHLAAGTSTGGMINKKFGRVGDSPVIGAGTYADDATCAVSATGHGEYFLRAVAGHDVAARMAYQGLPLAEAAAATLAKIDRLGGTGGLIAIDWQGNITLPFNTPGMYAGYRTSTGKSAAGIFSREPAPHP